MMMITSRVGHLLTEAGHNDLSPMTAMTVVFICARL